MSEYWIFKLQKQKNLNVHIQWNVKIQHAIRTLLN